jgi:tRNA dimethylallyltransferase
MRIKKDGINKNKKKGLPKIIVILGPTASGKTGLGVKLAYHLDGEIISADSRQIYKSMDIGTGKDLPNYNYKGKNIPYHLIDVASPRINFSIARYQKLAFKAIESIVKRGKLPIIVGGSGLYLQAVVDNYKLFSHKSDKKLRTELEKLGADRLFLKIKKLNPEFAKRINNSDKNNARRLSRYFELVCLGNNFFKKNKKSLYEFLVLGIKIDDKKMKENIILRLNQRIDKEGMIEEVKQLRKNGLSYKRLISFGLEYKYVSFFLQGKITEKEMREKLATAIYRFAKKQKTWFKRWQKQDRKIYWIESYEEAEKLSKCFI